MTDTNALVDLTPPPSPDRLVKISWFFDPPRRRTIIVSGRPRAIEIPTWTAFAHVQTKGGTLGAFHHSLYTWQVNGHPFPGALLRSSYFADMRSGAHVAPGGYCCVDHVAMNTLRTEPQLAFWASSWKVLPAWLARPRPADGVWRPETPAQNPPGCQTVAEQCLRLATVPGGYYLRVSLLGRELSAKSIDELGRKLRETGTDSTGLTRVAPRYRLRSSS